MHSTPHNRAVVVLQLWDFKRFGLHNLIGMATYELDGLADGEETTNPKPNPNHNPNLNPNPD